MTMETTLNSMKDSDIPLEPQKNLQTFGLSGRFPMETIDVINPPVKQFP